MSSFYQLMMKKKGMPSRYQEVEYIESTGTQYIDTKLIPNASMELICDVAFTDLSVGRFGAISTDSKRFYFGVDNSYFIGANSTAYNHTIMSADTNKHNFKLNDDGLYIDDTLVYSHSGSYPSETTARTIFLFRANSSASYFAKAKGYSSIIKQNGKVIRNFIPVYDTLTNKYGMWESVQGKFYGNDGTGDFAGA